MMELGIYPIVTSEMMMQLLDGANLMEVDFRVALNEDRGLFSTKTCVELNERLEQKLGQDTPFATLAAATGSP
jgi:hypothetical protein